MSKIDYGIYLGNDQAMMACCCDDDVRIIKSDEGLSDSIPACVYFDKKQRIIVGQRAIQARAKEAEDAFSQHLKDETANSPENSFIEFMRTMGSDKQYFSSNMERSFSSEELSAEVLKKLKSFVRDDDDVRAIIITVPAMFQQPQIDATQRAAELAGFDYCELLQEPIAASMAYGLSSKRTDGYWLVFDFGGGTFDAALMKVVEGIIKMVDTSGDNHLGGKDIDYAVVDEILIPCLSTEFEIDDTLNDDRSRQMFREALKSAAEEIKIGLASKPNHAVYKEDIGEDEEGEEIILDKTITLAEFENIVTPIIQRAIDICHKLLVRNNLTGKNLETVIFVGGPTYLQTMRRMVKEQLTEKIDVSIDPMTSVAKGAALFASTRDIPTTLQKRDKTRIQLKLRYPETTVETEEKLGIKVERTSTEGDVPTTLFAEVARNDKGWSSGRVELDGDAEIIDLHLLPGKTNGFTVLLFDAKGNGYPCEPSSFTIIQGLKVPNATLTLHLCTEQVHPERGTSCLVPIPGLEKNKPLPASGKDTFKTQIDLHPGNKADQIRIPLYNTEEAYSRAFQDELAGIFIITGEHISQFLPKDSEVQLTIDVDSCRRISCYAYLPYIEETVEHVFETVTAEPINVESLHQDIEEARHRLMILMLDAGGDDLKAAKSLKHQLDEIDKLRQNDCEKFMHKIASGLREIWKEIDLLYEKADSPEITQKLLEMLDQTKALTDSPNTTFAGNVRLLHQLAQNALRRQDYRLARKSYDRLYSICAYNFSSY